MRQRKSTLLRMDRISQIKVFLHVFPIKGSHIPDIVPHKFFTMPMVPKDNGYHVHHQRMPFLCVPCILFSDAILRGQHLRLNQGIAFTQVGFRSWKRQHSSALQHEAACILHIGVQ